MPPKESEVAAYAATSKIDFYEILSIPTDTTSDNILRKAFRKQSLLWHPDKNQAPDAPEKFHLLTVAYDVLSDPTTKAAYDNARIARLAKTRRSEAFDLNRRKMQLELEDREKRAKRARIDTDNEEDHFKAQLAKLQKEGVQLRLKRDYALQAAANEYEGQESQETQWGLRVPTSRFSELDRSISVRWRRTGEGKEIGEENLRNLFARFGKVQECIVMKSKDKGKKLHNGLVVFDSVVGAHSAVCDALKSKDESFKYFKFVNWASGKEPDFANTLENSTPRPSTLLPDNIRPPSPTLSRIPIRQDWLPTSKEKLERLPSFASFISPSKHLPFSKSEISETPDYESITLMRMRDAEKKRLESDILKKVEVIHEDING